jgi:hypothetical protein
MVSELFQKETPIARILMKPERKEIVMAVFEEVGEEPHHISSPLFRPDYAGLEPEKLPDAEGIFSIRGVFPVFGDFEFSRIFVYKRMTGGGPTDHTTVIKINIFVTVFVKKSGDIFGSVGGTAPNVNFRIRIRDLLGNFVHQAGIKVIGSLNVKGIKFRVGSHIDHVSLFFAGHDILVHLKELVHINNLVCRDQRRKFFIYFLFLSLQRITLRQRKR